MNKNYDPITPNGLLNLENEYSLLKRIERPKIVETVSWAASNGDRSENADYHYGKKKLREIDKRLSYLSKRINTVTAVDPLKQSSTKIQFGATVTILDEENNKQVYYIVGLDESDACKGKISYTSPLAQALLNKEIGDYVSFKTPKGERDIEIIDFSYSKIPD